MGEVEGMDDFCACRNCKIGRSHWQCEAFPEEEEEEVEREHENEKEGRERWPPLSSISVFSSTFPWAIGVQTGWSSVRPFADGDGGGE